MCWNLGVVLRMYELAQHQLLMREGNTKASAYRQQTTSTALSLEAGNIRENTTYPLCVHGLVSYNWGEIDRILRDKDFLLLSLPTCLSASHSFVSIWTKDERGYSGGEILWLSAQRQKTRDARNKTNKSSSKGKNSIFFLFSALGDDVRICMLVQKTILPNYNKKIRIRSALLRRLDSNNRTWPL